MTGAIEYIALGVAALVLCVVIGVIAIAAIVRFFRRRSAPVGQAVATLAPARQPGLTETLRQIGYSEADRILAQGFGLDDALKSAAKLSRVAERLHAQHQPPKPPDPKA